MGPKELRHTWNGGSSSTLAQGFAGWLRKFLLTLLQYQITHAYIIKCRLIGAGVICYSSCASRDSPCNPLYRYRLEG